LKKEDSLVNHNGIIPGFELDKNLSQEKPVSTIKILA